MSRTEHNTVSTFPHYSRTPVHHRWQVQHAISEYMLKQSL